MFELIEQHERIFLLFSGGKDSLALLHLAKHHWDKLAVVWVNTGDAFPETRAQMEAVKVMVPYFLEIKSDQPKHIKEHGWPSDIIPVRSTQFGRLIEGHKDPLLHGYPICCNANIWSPLLEAIKHHGITLILKGTKACDTRKGIERPGAVLDGVTHCLPLWDYTDEEVFTVLQQLGVKLPNHYAQTKTSLDCMHCTAYLDENAGKMAYLAKHYPDVSTVVQGRLRLITHAVRRDMDHLRAARTV